MAKFNEKVMALVETELGKNPLASVDDLFQKAKAAAPSIGKLTKRQFHAQYPLQVKRRKKASTKEAAAPKAKAKPAARKKAAAKKQPAKAKAAPKKKQPAKAKAAPRARPTRARRAPRAAAAPPATKPSADREAIRETFLKFATDMAAAQERQDLVKLLSRVDRYVDTVVKAAGAA